MSSHRQKFSLHWRIAALIAAPFLVACQSSYYDTEHKRTELPVHQVMEKADKTIWREFSRLDEYCQEVIDESDLSLKPLLDEGGRERYQYRDHICYEQRDWYSTEHRADEFERERVLALMNSRVPITLERSAAQQRDLKSPQDVYYHQQFADGELPDTNPVLNHLYSKDSRVDTMLYEWFRVNQELSVIEEFKTCLEERDLSRMLANDMNAAEMLSTSPISQTRCDELFQSRQVERQP